METKGAFFEAFSFPSQIHDEAAIPPAVCQSVSFLTTNRGTETGE
jgi:hypothetical protein